jgi:hypothetical protein
LAEDENAAQTDIEAVTVKDLSSMNAEDARALFEYELHDVPTQDELRSFQGDVDGVEDLCESEETTEPPSRECTAQNWADDAFEVAQTEQDVGDDSAAELQAALPNIGFLTSPSDVGTSADRNAANLPEPVRDALLNIMQFGADSSRSRSDENLHTQLLWQ